jgi:hypothetical protein
LKNLAWQVPMFDFAPFQIKLLQKVSSVILKFYGARISTFVVMKTVKTEAKFLPTIFEFGESFGMSL